MSTASVITGIVLLLIVMLAIGYFSYKQNQKVKILVSKLKNFADKHATTISNSGVHNNNVIGIDGTGEKLFFVNHVKNIYVMVDLRTIKVCKITEGARMVNTNYGNQKVIDNVDLTLIPIDPKSNLIHFEYFNVNNGDIQLSGELQFLDKWVQIINSQIRSLK